MAASLVLEDGSVFSGISFGARREISGEVVFQTGLVGYPQSVTDPSYHRQILVLTYPLIGNYGVPDPKEFDENGLLKWVESRKIWVAGVIVSENVDKFSHWNAKLSFSDWMKSEDVPGIEGVDTRHLTKIIRDKGSVLGAIFYEDSLKPTSFLDPNILNLVDEVSTKDETTFKAKENFPHVAVIDVGVKMSQIKCLLEHELKVTVVPWNYDIEKNLKRFSGIFISNGPGDPSMCQKLIDRLKKIVESDKNIPIFGICLGHQLLARAAGLKTFKMKYGNRGHNQPCRFMSTEQCFVTSQNHGFAVDDSQLPLEWVTLFTNQNDNSNEGIANTAKPFFSVQFHPEHCAGPEDARFLFGIFASKVKQYRRDSTCDASSVIEDIKKHLCYPSLYVPPKPKKVLILGSGGLSIGQAGEFDYSGSQAIKALREENVQIVLINPNIATVQTNPGFAHKVYFDPITYEYVVEVIELERPDGILLMFGGQTALNCGIELEKGGIFNKYGVKVLGTPITSIKESEDRELFAKVVQDVGAQVVRSQAAKSLEEAVEIGSKIGYPILVRAAYALGGLGSGFASNASELKKLVSQCFVHSTQVFLDKSLKGWKEVEYEVVRDIYDNCVTVCNMENMDPLGVHTGESIVVAPSQTLTDAEYQKLRTMAIKIVRRLGVVGECNVQYALSPHSEQFYIIEVNARLSRSSALASKATGYPLAYVAAKLALGYSLTSINNSMTHKTACFEPSLDYCVVKMPRWDLNKFAGVSRKIGSSMKSVGEVMAIGRKFEEAFQKAIRMVDENYLGFEAKEQKVTDIDISTPTDERVLTLAAAFEQGYSVSRLHELTNIDCWFLSKLENIYRFREEKMKMMMSVPSDPSKIDDVVVQVILEAKKLGFSDKQIAKSIKLTETYIRSIRHKNNIHPFVKQVDTVSGEWPAFTNYLYTTYNADSHDVQFGNESAVMVLGSGVYRIGCSVEFDCCAVGCVQELRKMKRPTILINYNPETVSTDYDMCERLYFDELSFEVVMDIYELENPAGVILSMGGQLPNNIAKDLNQMKVRIIGTSAESIDGAENRFKFSRTLDIKNIAQPEWKELTDVQQAKEFCARVGYPCIVRPSYVLSGAAMNVATTPDDLEIYLKQAKTVSKENPVVISKFVMDAKEIDVDAVAKNGVLVSMAVSEHVENAGVHSGDATLVTPPQDLNSETLSRITSICAEIGKELSVNGPYNLQVIAKDNELKVIECNLRVSRSFPFVSKTLGYDFVAAATRAMMDQEVETMMIIPIQKNDFTSSSGVCVPRVGVKVAQFSFSRLAGADFMLGVEMASTGEVACFGANRYQAYLKALLSTGFRMPKKNILLSIGTYRHKVELEASVKNLHELGYKLFGSKGTSDFYNTQFKANIVRSIEWPFADVGADGSITIQSIAEFLAEKELDLVINLPMTSGGSRRVSTHGYRTRRFAVDHAVPLIADVKCAKLFVQALTELKIRAGIENWKKKLPILTNIDCLTSQNILRFPGLIDVHVHFREPGQTHKEDFESGSAAALSGGITAVCVMPNTQPNITSLDDLQHVRDAAQKKCRIDYAIFMMASATNAGEWASIQVEKPPIALKMYLDSTFVDNPLKNMRIWKDHFEHWPRAMPICVHAEGLTMAAILLFANIYNRAVHICHVSREEEILVIKKAKEEGVQVTCEVTPHHLFLCQDDVAAIGQGWSEVRPVLGEKKDQDALWNNLDVIDVFASDHAPHTRDEKGSENAPPGFPGVDTMLPLLLNAVHEGRLTETAIIEKMYKNPKRIFNLPDQPNTYVEVDMDETWTIGEHYFSKSNWSPFAGKQVRGRVRRVVVRNKLAFVDGQVLLPPMYGKEMFPVGEIGSRSGSFVDHPEQREHNLPSSPQKANFDGAIGAVREGSVYSNGSSFVSQLEELRGNNILTVTTFKRDILHPLFNLAQNYKKKVQQGNCKSLQKILKGKVVGLLFFEASTRTFCSFNAAAVRLGAQVIPLPVETSSMKKGESLEDTVSTIASYVNSLVIRHPEPGAVMRVSSIPSVMGKPVINAGDGTGEHPTQALLDVFTIREEIGTVNGLIVTMVGDLKNGRTVHSLARLLAVYDVAELRYVALQGLEMPHEVIEYVTERSKGKIKQTLMTNLKEAVVDTDVLYVTRVQKERGVMNGTGDLCQELRVTPELMTLARKPKMIVMHPLPRNEEISPEFDVDPRAAYFKQMENGIYVRMALLTALLAK